MCLCLGGVGVWNYIEYVGSQSLRLLAVGKTGLRQGESPVPAGYIASNFDRSA